MDSSSPVGGDGGRSLYGAADESPPLQSKPAEGAEGENGGGGSSRLEQPMEPFSIDDSSYDDPGDTSSESWLDNDASSPSPEMAQTATTPTTTTTITDGRMRWLFGIMGLGTLFPYNAIITCEDYYSELHPNANDVAGQLAAYCLTALLVTTLLLLPISTPPVAEGGEKLVATTGMPRGGRAWLGCMWRYVTSWLSSPVRRIYLGYSMCLLSLLLLAALKQPSMALLNASSFLVGMADATSQSGLYVFAASYHRPSYTAAVTFGSAVAGLAVGVLRLITRGLFDTESLGGLRKGVAVLYLLSSTVIIGCLWALHTLLRDTHPLVNEEAARPSAVESTGESCAQENVANSSANELVVDELYDANDNSNGRFKVYWETIRVTWKPTLAAFLNFFITLSLFPGTVASITSSPVIFDGEEDGDGGESPTGILSLGDWLPVVLITTFNAADCVGRGLLNIDRLGLVRMLLLKRDAVQAGHQENDQNSLPPPTRVLFPYMNMLVWWHCFSRVIFYPLLALCILPVEPIPLISSDVIRILIVFAFGVSNGFVNCAAFVVAPTMVTGERHRDASSLLLLLSIYSGLTFGSYFGLIVDLVLRTLAAQR